MAMAHGAFQESKESYKSCIQKRTHIPNYAHSFRKFTDLFEAVSPAREEKGHGLPRKVLENDESCWKRDLEHDKRCHLFLVKGHALKILKTSYLSFGVPPFSLFNSTSPLKLTIT